MYHIENKKTNGWQSAVLFYLFNFLRRSYTELFLYGLTAKLTLLFTTAHCAELFFMPFKIYLFTPENCILLYGHFSFFASNIHTIKNYVCFLKSAQSFCYKRPINPYRRYLITAETDLRQSHFDILFPQQTPACTIKKLQSADCAARM